MGALEGRALLQRQPPPRGLRGYMKVELPAGLLDEEREEEGHGGVDPALPERVREQLAAAESRARTYVSRDEMQLAGDVIFTEVRDILAAATTQVPGGSRCSPIRRSSSSE